MILDKFIQDSFQKIPKAHFYALQCFQMSWRRYVKLTQSILFVFHQLADC